MNGTLGGELPFPSASRQTQSSPSWVEMNSGVAAPSYRTSAKGPSWRRWPPLMIGVLPSLRVSLSFLSSDPPGSEDWFGDLVVLSFLLLGLEWKSFVLGYSLALFPSVHLNTLETSFWPLGSILRLRLPSLMSLVLVRAHPQLFSEETITILKTTQLKPTMIL